jgi:uncharacterized membrane protein YcaP (DUF421 family)
MDPWRVAVRAIAAYVYLLFATRAAGKRVIAQATAFDFVVALIIGDLIDDALWAEVSLARFATAVTAIVGADIIVKLLARRFDFVFKLVAGGPRLVMRSGAAKKDELRRLQLKERDLDSLLRQKEVADSDEVREARVEIDGQLSVLKEEWAEPVQRRDRDKLVEALS